MGAGVRPVTMTLGPSRATALATSKTAPRPPPEKSSTQLGSTRRSTWLPSLGKSARRRPTTKRRLAM